MVISTGPDPTRSAAADAAAAPLDLLLTDGVTGMVRRVNPGGSGLRLGLLKLAWAGVLAGQRDVSRKMGQPISVRQASGPGSSRGPMR